MVSGKNNKTSDGDTVEQRFRLLQESYLQQMQDKIDRLEVLWSELQAEPFVADKYDGVYHILHGLIGSGSTFGFSGISQTARNMSGLVRRLQQQGVKPDDKSDLKFVAWINALHQAIREGVPDQPVETPVISVRQNDSASELADIPGRRHVYVVDDDRQMADELADQLRVFEYEVTVFTSLPAFHAALLRQAPSAVIMDVMFPEGNGARFLEEIRKNNEIEIPVIFISAHGDFDSRLQGVRAGGVAWFEKAIDLGKLVDCLDTHTQRRREEPYYIVVVEDSPTLASYFAVTLEQVGMTVDVYGTPREALAMLEKGRPDLVLMDVYMPECSGLELAHMMRQIPSFDSVPIVFLSGETDVDKQLAAMSLGGDDFLTKPIKPSHLISTVTARASRSRLLRSVMERDSLTGLYNHTVTKEKSEKMLQQQREKNADVVFAMLDIDHFKSVNDTWGHQVGDQVIQSLARLLRQRLRGTDIIGRYGGEEFAVAMPNISLQQAEQKLNELRESFEQIPQRSQDQVFHVTLSCGLASGREHESLKTLNDAADRALYVAKNNGRNRIVISEPGQADLDQAV